MIVGVGTDIESISRFRKLWISKPSILSKLFYKSEVDYAINKEKPWETLAGIWCAKESVVKSLSSVHSLNVKEVEIGKPSPEKYQVNLSISELEEKEFLFWISISHSREYATAFCVAEVLMKCP
ncbi:MAG: 4'-phosphopantetheinyl transferase superfamily protein [Flavobacteriales bacterium]|nr:4'-phosphopantetheinyl transferase superfamily protein [Flavobacteriales bacterium]